MNEMPFLKFDISLSSPVLSTGDKLHELFEGLFSLTFPSVADLNLDIDLAHSDAFTDQQFGNLLSSFSSVEAMTTTLLALHCLDTESSIVDTSNLFPQLQTLDITKQKQKNWLRGHASHPSSRHCDEVREFAEALGRCTISIQAI